MGPFLYDMINFFCLNFNNRVVKESKNEIRLNSERARPSSLFRNNHPPSCRPIRLTPSIDLNSRQRLLSVSNKKNLTPDLENPLETDRVHRNESSFSLPKDDKNFDSVVNFSEFIKKHFRKRKHIGMLRIPKKKEINSEISEFPPKVEKNSIQDSSQLNEMPNNLTDRSKDSIKITFSPSKKKNTDIMENKICSNPSFRLFQPKVLTKHQINHQVQAMPPKLKISLAKKGSFLKNVFKPDCPKKAPDSSQFIDVQQIQQDLHVRSSEPINFQPKLGVENFQEDLIFSPHSVAYIDLSISFY